MNISITNTSAAVTNAEKLLHITNEINSVKESIQYILGELSEYWAATQEDQQSFYGSLEKGVMGLEKIVQCNKDFSNAVMEYVEAISTTSQNSVTTN